MIIKQDHKIIKIIKMLYGDTISTHGTGKL